MDELPNTPSKQVLLQHAIGDPVVHYLGAYFIARAIGASMFVSNVADAGVELYGFPFVQDRAVI